MSAAPVAPGYRFKLRRDVVRLPHFVAREGYTGTVTSVDEKGQVVARIDQNIPGAAEWNNCLHWKAGFLDDTAPLVPDGW